MILFLIHIKYIFNFFQLSFSKSELSGLLTKEVVMEKISVVEQKSEVPNRHQLIKQLWKDDLPMFDEVVAGKTSSVADKIDKYIESVWGQLETCRIEWDDES
jgi:hypothetical protein